MLNEDVDLGVIKVTKDKDVSKVILGWVEGLVLVTVMMIVIVEVVGEVMVIIDVVDNQYTARGVHKGGAEVRRISYCICLFCKFIYSFSNFPPFFLSTCIYGNQNFIMRCRSEAYKT